MPVNKKPEVAQSKKRKLDTKNPKQAGKPGLNNSKLRKLNTGVKNLVKPG